MEQEGRVVLSVWERLRIKVQLKIEEFTAVNWIEWFVDEEKKFMDPFVEKPQKVLDIAEKWYDGNMEEVMIIMRVQGRICRTSLTDRDMLRLWI